MQPASPARFLSPPVSAGQGGRPRHLLQASCSASRFAIQFAYLFTPFRCLQVKEGDRVIYFKYAGDAMETPSGEKFNVLHASDILAKL